MRNLRKQLTHLSIIVATLGGAFYIMQNCGTQTTDERSGTPADLKTASGPPGEVTPPGSIPPGSAPSDAGPETLPDGWIFDPVPEFAAHKQLATVARCMKLAEHEVSPDVSAEDTGSACGMLKEINEEVVQEEEVDFYE